MSIVDKSDISINTYCALKSPLSIYFAKSTNKLYERAMGKFFAS